MATLARLYDFTAGQPILSGEVDGEFNQIINALNGTSTNVNLSTRFSSATVAALKLDQLGAGPIQEWAQSGSVKSYITNSGQFRSDIATGTAPLVIGSTTLCANLNADLLDGVEGASYARKDSASDQTFIGSLVISKTAPELYFVDTDNTKQMRWSLDDAAFALINDTAGGNPLSFNTATNVGTFVAIPVLPASSPTTDNQATRKKYVDDSITARYTLFSAAWFYSVPPGSTETTESVPRFTVPAGLTASTAINSITIAFAGGSHTSGGTLTFTIKRRNAAGTLQSDIGTITINDSGPAINVVSVTAPGDTALAANDQIYPLLTTRSGTITETLITITVGGYQFTAA